MSFAKSQSTSLLLVYFTNTCDDIWDLADDPAGQIASQTQSNNGFVFNAYTSSNIGYVANNLNQYTSLTPAGG